MRAIMLAQMHPLRYGIKFIKLLEARLLVMALNLHLLRVFATAARFASFSRAAEALLISQSAVSKGVREFERQLGMRLFERGTGKVVLTEPGEILLRHADLLFAAERGAEAELQSLRGLAQGRLHVGASTTIATYILPPLLGAFHEAHPAIHLRLTSANTRDVANLLIAKAIDLAFIEGPIDIPGLTLIPWRLDELVVVAAPSHPLAATRYVTPADLARYRHIIREPGSGTREVTEAALRDHGITPAEIMEVGSTEAIMHCAAAGLGIAIVSKAAAADKTALGSLSIVQVNGLTIARSLYRLAVAGRSLSAAALTFDAFAERTASDQKMQFDYVI
jgi:DNA-binding transcriptional LysR family regulator